MAYCSEVPLKKILDVQHIFSDGLMKANKAFYFYFCSSLHDIFLLKAIFIYLKEGKNIQNANIFCTLSPILDLSIFFTYKPPTRIMV